MITHRSSQKEVPQLFIIMTYLYTVHPTLTISNVHVYVPADVNDLDTTMCVIAIPEVVFKGRREGGV